jgi:integrase
MKELEPGIVKRSSPRKFLFDFMDKYIAAYEGLREPGSMVVYKALKNHLENFEQVNKRKVQFENIDTNFFLDFQKYLLSLTLERDGKQVPRMNNITVAKQLSTLKTFLNYARKQKVDVNLQYKDFAVKKEKLEVLALTNNEFQTLYDIDLKNTRLAQVRDVFCFACVTGLRYSDLAQLRWEHIKADEIKITVKKTKDPLRIPLTPYSVEILKRYHGQLRPLPVISNQKMNKYTKELCALAGIDEPIEIVRFYGARREVKVYAKHELIGVHTARKTFVTLSLERGMTAEEVMATSGHLDYKSFKRYVKITEDRKKTAMGQAWGSEIVNPKLKAV